MRRVNKLARKPEVGKTQDSWRRSLIQAIGLEQVVKNLLPGPFIPFLQFSYMTLHIPRAYKSQQTTRLLDLSSLKHIHILINGKNMVSLHAIEKHKSLNVLSVLLTTNSSLKRQHIYSFHQKLPNL